MSQTTPMEYLGFAKAAVTVGVLALLWTWETWLPFFERPEGRLRHAGRNLAVAILNTVILGLAFSTVVSFVAAWSVERQCGLLHAFDLGAPAQFGLALVLLDGWMYLWHRANHMVPFLWRFHRMHHTDTRMDVTTATRFHLGEHIGGSILRTALIPVLGFEVWQLIVYDTLVIGVTMLHHANISLGRYDRWLRSLIVTPDMHKVHHSNWRIETDSNYSTVFSAWDRLARSFQMRADPKTLVFGLDEFPDPGWQTVWGMLRTPFITPPADATRLEHREAVETDCRPRKRVLFICVENSNRSQMAEAFARMYAVGRVEAYSAGSQPSGRVHPKAIEAMRELGYDLTRHHSKGLVELPDLEYDVAVMMACGDCPKLRARVKEVWDIPCPKEMSPEQFRAVRDQIEEKVKELLASFDLALQQSP